MSLSKGTSRLLLRYKMSIEKSEMKSQERKKEKKFSRGGSSSGKRLRES